MSFAVDTSQLVGGDWWDPKARSKELGTGSVPAIRVDFDRPRLDALVRPLLPAFLRVGGSEADKLYYDPEGQREAPPAGYASILHADRWAELQRFVDRHGLDLVFTLNAGPSARDDDGRWVPDNAESLLRHAQARGDRIARFELGNEANLFWYVFGPMHAARAEQYARDLRAARALVTRHFPEAQLTGQSSAFWPVIGEPLSLLFDFQEDYLRAAGRYVDYVSWHYYPQQSRRCFGASRRAHPARLLEPKHLDEVATYADWNARWRDRHAPGKPLWMGETGNAQCGGEPGVSDRFVASLWWLDQLGLLARHAHDVVVRQTLTGSDYGLLSEPELEPRPDYWASVLWKRFMGVRVLDVASDDRLLRVYAHCASVRAAAAGSVTVLALNLDPHRPAVLALEEPVRAFVVDAPDAVGRTVRLNGRPLAFRGANTSTTVLPRLETSGRRQVEPTLPPISYGFFVIDGSASACP